VRKKEERLLATPCERTRLGLVPLNTPNATLSVFLPELAVGGFALKLLHAEVLDLDLALGNKVLDLPILVVCVLFVLFYLLVLRTVLVLEGLN